jgi:hypothetical protein
MARISGHRHSTRQRASGFFLPAFAASGFAALSWAQQNDDFAGLQVLIDNWQQMSFQHNFFFENKI